MARSFPGTAGAGDARDAVADEPVINLQRRRDQLNARLAELQWDLGGLAYEMAIRDRFRVEVIIKQAAELQVVDSELSEIERILQLEKTHIAGVCPHCSAPHSSGASFCWQCGGQIMHEIDSSSIFTSNAAD
jgi:hypothetical protein